ncbi:MAG TPA: DnaJ domain-containing protein [Allosphingosinicella sp.]|jgi:curved DNA-binding protein CbpA
MASPRSYYEVLNVAADAEGVVIEAAYRALMKKYHPDQGAPPPREGAPSAADINQAYSVLREPARRAEYDQKEWTRQQSVQLASYTPPPPPRRNNFFGWGGWLVAAVLAAMIAIMASKGGAPALGAAEAARAAMLSEPDFRSQPTRPGQSVISEADAADIRAEAYLGGVKPADAAPVPAPAPAAKAPPAAIRRQPWVRSWHRLPRRPTPQPRSSREKDFLERQGYIY